ncbi:MAG TPA: MarR family transcriptional regulator [Desulfosporosinus sp.]|nr:MarR family transcriptional regulator [Desulfosporosinus sp.]
MEKFNESSKVAKLFQEVMILFKHSMSKVIEEMHQGMTAPQGMVMGILSKEKTIMISELSNKLSLSNSTVSGIIDRLEKQGMVVRKRSEEDRRVVHVSMSPNFTGVHQNFHKHLEENIGKVLNKGTPEELDKIYVGLDVLKTLLSDGEE